MIVAIDGIDGSGKSVLSRALMARFGGAVLFNIDDFRRPVAWGADDRSEADLYYDDYYDLDALERCMQAMNSGAPAVEIPNWDPIAEVIDGTRTIDLSGADVAIVEGVFARRVPMVRSAAIGVYLMTSFDEARRRIMARDTARGRTAAEVARRIDERYFPSQRRYIAEHAPEDNADVVIDNEDPSHPTVVRAADHVPADLLDTLIGR